MLSTQGLIGLALIIISAAMIFIFSLPKSGHKKIALRPITGFQRLRRATGLAVEEGKRLHVSIGNADLLTPQNASALVGLSTLERIGEISMISDRPPIATSGNGALSLLTQDTLRAVYRAGNAPGQYDPARGQLTGPTPLSYIAGTIPIIRDEQISANIFVGNFGPEVALLCEQSDRERAYTLAASDSLPAQAVMFAAAQEPLIGEELFAVPAYLNARPVYAASLRTQDVLRWVIIAILVLGAVIKLISGLLGINIL